MKAVGASDQRGELRYAVGASMVLWYGPPIAAFFVGPLADAQNGRTDWLRYFAILPGMLAKVVVDSPSEETDILVAGGATLVLLGGVAVLWLRMRQRRASLAIVTLALSVANAIVLAALFTL